MEEWCESSQPACLWRQLAICAATAAACWLAALWRITPPAPGRSAPALNPPFPGGWHYLRGAGGCRPQPAQSPGRCSWHARWAGAGPSGPHTHPTCMPRTTMIRPGSSSGCLTHPNRDRLRMLRTTAETVQHSTPPHPTAQPTSSRTPHDSPGSPRCTAGSTASRRLRAGGRCWEAVTVSE